MQGVVSAPSVLSDREFVAKANSVRPGHRSYVEWPLSEMPNDPALRAKGADVSRYLPWSPEVPESCRATGAHFREELGVAGEPVVDLAGISA